jgi:hypothetical protein
LKYKIRRDRILTNVKYKGACDGGEGFKRENQGSGG